MTEPRIILLDEPFSGVDPIAVEDLQQEIRTLREAGIACLITDHNVHQTLKVCDRAYIINDGKVFAEGAPGPLIKNELVRRTYLGSLFRGDEFDGLENGSAASYRLSGADRPAEQGRPSRRARPAGRASAEGPVPPPPERTP
ncbi:MAG: hypothetical protein KatS3mg103_0689 [Phycisphaerales bacterium]|nr:MAG: hypothetical protein KatS3mg103_0689 [Phycisphaerales bacterium]